MNFAAFETLPLMGILRGITADKVEPVLEAAIKGGLKTIEIAMNTKDALSLIKIAKKYSCGRISLGAGTVLNKDDLEHALSAGATFIVMPVAVKEVIQYCAKESVPVFPGALTPTEVFKAWDYGASMVKVFPSGVFGPSYIKELKGPLDKIKLLAVGGVSVEKIKEYFKCGAGAVAFGSSVFKKDWIEKGDFSSIRKSIEGYVAEVKKCLKTEPIN